LHSLQGVDAEAEELGPLVLIDTAGCGMEEAADEDSDSKRNEGEAQVTPLGTEGHPHCLGVAWRCCHFCMLRSVSSHTQAWEDPAVNGRSQHLHAAT
jgi:hypothetical protein